MPKTESRNVLIIAASEYDANLYYTSGFLAPDSFVFVQTQGKKHLLMSDLEVDRARAQAKADQVHSLSALSKTFQEKNGKRGGYLDLIEFFCKNQNTLNFDVPGNFPLEYADKLRQRGFTLTPQPEPFFPERTVKTKEEIAAITRAVRFTEDAVKMAIEALRKTVIQQGKLYLDGAVFTSEALRKIINVRLMENNCIAENSIVACGLQGVDPHDRGSGPLYADQSIIMDIFPRDCETRYYADLSRTVVRGKASPKLKKMFEAVKQAQQMGIDMIREGVDGSAVHGAIQKQFEEQGFKTGVQNGRMQGFFHGTGHGLGLDIHEAPRVSLGKDILKAGQVVTVEPGLYYEDAGGVRLEDDVVVTKTGCINLMELPKILEI
jgi:Xaa-Pro aminopeptidase